jgi:hypothetical protein
MSMTKLLTNSTPCLPITDRRRETSRARTPRACRSALAIAFIAGTGCEVTDDPGSLAEHPVTVEVLGERESTERYVVSLSANASGDVTAAPGDVDLAAWSPICAVHARTPVPWTHPTGVRTWLLPGGTVFQKDDFCQWGKSAIVMQPDGNFVLYDENRSPRWASNTFGTGQYATFQTDGNLVVYNVFGQALHTGTVPSNTCCNQGYNLHVQADGNMVIYAPGWQPRWSTGTFH